MSHRKGRPVEYSNQELKKILLAYSVKNKGKISYLQLEKVTGIKRHVWARRLKEEINKLNQPIMNKMETGNSDEIPLPNIEEIVERYADNKTGLIRVLGHLNEVIIDLYDQTRSSKQQSLQLQELKQSLKETERIISQLKNEMNYYKQLYEQAYVKSTYSTLRHENSLKENLISINKNKERSLSTNIEKAFPELFCDD